MTSQSLFFVGLSQQDSPKIKSAAIALSNSLQRRFLEYSSNQSPCEILQSLPEDKLLVYLEGDVALFHSPSGSWLEALGAWKKPVVLMAIPLDSGDIPGTAAAYVSLCKQLSVPTLGLIQLGGHWEVTSRKLDGLPWCGWLPDEFFFENSDINKSNVDDKNHLDDLAAHLNLRIKGLNAMV